MHDRDLLQDYVLNHSEASFSELVSRHLGLVYGAARRVVGDGEMAKDVAQMAFTKLATHAATVRNGDALAGWLYRVTCAIGYSALRAEARRRKRENESMKLTEIESESPAAWATIGPLLDEAMQRLDEEEQNAVVLRYFEGRNLREVGLTLNLSDDAAHKRIRRALDKIRAYFARHQVTVGGVVAAAVIAANSVQAAPAGLAAGIADNALATASAQLGAGGAKMAFVKKLVLAGISLATVAAAVFLYAQTPAEAPPAEIPARLSAPAPAPAATPEAPGTESWMVPMMLAENGEAQFVLNSLRKVGSDTIALRADGAVTRTAGGFYLEYKIGWQIFDGATESPDKTRAKDDFEMQSSVTLQPNVPFVLWRDGGRALSIATDGKAVTIQLIQPQGF